MNLKISNIAKTIIYPRNVHLKGFPYKSLFKMEDMGCRTKNVKTYFHK